MRQITILFVRPLDSSVAAVYRLEWAIFVESSRLTLSFDPPPPSPSASAALPFPHSGPSRDHLRGTGIIVQGRYQKPSRGRCGMSLSSRARMMRDARVTGAEKIFNGTKKISRWHAGRAGDRGTRRVRWGGVGWEEGGSAFIAYLLGGTGLS